VRQTNQAKKPRSILGSRIRRRVSVRNAAAVRKTVERDWYESHGQGERVTALLRGKRNSRLRGKNSLHGTGYPADNVEKEGKIATGTDADHRLRGLRSRGL